MSKEERELSYDEFELPKNRKKRILSDLEELDDFESGSGSVFLASSIAKEEKEKKKKKHDEPQPEDVGSWLTTLSELSISNVKGRAPKNFLSSKKDKKKKKKQKDGPTDYKKEFEPEVALMDNLLIEQTRFVDNLQQKYDRMESVKSSARGTGKFTTDLISNINQARQLAVQLVDKKIAVKKTVAELEMKEKKELNGGVDVDDLNNYSAEFLKNLMTQRHELVGGFSDMGIEDMDEDGLANVLDNNITDERGEEVAAYLKYENSNVTILCLVNPNDQDDYEFIAETASGEILTDYPLPDKTGITLNRSTMIATDAYGQKFKAEFRE